KGRDRGSSRRRRGGKGAAPGAAAFRRARARVLAPPQRPRAAAAARCGRGPARRLRSGGLRGVRTARGWPGTARRASRRRARALAARCRAAEGRADGIAAPAAALCGADGDVLEGFAAGISGSDPSAAADLAQLAVRLGMTPLLTRDRCRALYHAAAVLAAGAQVALFSEATRAFRKATGLPEPQARAALLPLALGALEKLRREPPEAAITGPALRGDEATIAAPRKA